MRKFANFLWIDKEGENYTIRMTPELQDDVGTIGFVQFNMDDQLEAEDEILSLEASKTVMSIVTPLAGKVVARNLAATEDPKLLNSISLLSILLGFTKWLLTDISNPSIETVTDV